MWAGESVFKFNEGWQTGYSDTKGLIFVKGDVLPDMNSLHPRDLMSPIAVLAHEYYGHKILVIYMEVKIQCQGHGMTNSELVILRR